MKARSHLIHLTYLTCLTLFAAFSSLGQTPFNVTGITDRTTYNNSVSLTVVTEPGYTYALYLNGTNMSSGGSYTIRDPDF